MNKKEKLRLYVWEDETSKCYYQGLAFAIASNEKEALNMIHYVGGDDITLEELKAYPLKKAIAFFRGGGD